MANLVGLLVAVRYTMNALPSANVMVHLFRIKWYVSYAIQTLSIHVLFLE